MLSLPVGDLGPDLCSILDFPEISLFRVTATSPVQVVVSFLKASKSWEYFVTGHRVTRVLKEGCVFPFQSPPPVVSLSHQIFEFHSELSVEVGSPFK